MLAHTMPMRNGSEPEMKMTCPECQVREELAQEGGPENVPVRSIGRRYQEKKALVLVPVQLHNNWLSIFQQNIQR
jgi:hypothetical protein